MAILSLAAIILKSLLITQNVELPLKSQLTEDLRKSTIHNFEQIVHRNDCFEMNTRTNEHGHDGRECSIPLFGEKTKISFFFQPPPSPSTFSSSSSSFGQYVLQIDAEDEKDYQWICTKLLHEMKDVDIGGGGRISMFPLQKLVANIYNSLPPSSGYDSKETANNDLLSDMNIFSSQTPPGDEWIKLKKNGFITIDTQLKTSDEACQKLSNLLKYKTGQDREIRSDTVTFLTREEATNCGLGLQFDTLMAIASKMNDEFDFEDSPFQPLFPGTMERPITNPDEIQAAEYKYGEFYIEHSDNSLDETNKRRNYRCFTYILYCNNEWDMEEDGGALRIYLNSEKIKVPSDAKKSCEYVDISPKNGRLLIFDSRLIHAVRKTTSKSKRRLALTLWTLRPEQSGVRGEIYDEGLEDT